MLNEFMKLGQVVEVRGQKIRIRVFENKNGPILLYKGNIIKNVSVGSFIKIPKGYISIIGKIEGEHISELKEKNAAQRFQKESDSIERMIDVSVLGVMEKGIFIKGILEIPLVFSDAYILEEHELQMVFSFFENKENAISLGKIAEYKDYQLYVDAQQLFASHIGIFGNTGSGKSNTLAAIYTALFQKYGERPHFQKSHFVMFDFNGEYENAFTKDKIVYRLSTAPKGGDKIPIPEQLFANPTFWSILGEASDKTQRPFLERVIEEYLKLQNSAQQGKKQLLHYLRKKVFDLFLCCYREGKTSIDSRNDLAELFEILLVNTKNLHQSKKRECIKRNLASKIEKYTGEKDFVNHGAEPFLKLLLEENLKQAEIFEYFLFALKYREILETTRRYALREFITPMTKRLEMRISYLKRIFLPMKKVHLTHNMEVISLLDVYGDLKRLIPAVLCNDYYDRQKARKQGSLHIIIDEAHSVLSPKQEQEDMLWKDHCIEIFEELVKEGRKFGTFLTISSQRPSDISESILSQMHNHFIHRLINKEDVQAIERSVVFMEESSFQMFPVLPQGACIFAGVASNFPVMVQMDMIEKQYMLSSDTIDLVRFWNQE